MSLPSLTTRIHASHETARALCLQWMAIEHPTKQLTKNIRFAKQEIFSFEIKKGEANALINTTRFSAHQRMEIAHNLLEWEEPAQSLAEDFNAYAPQLARIGIKFLFMIPIQDWDKAPALAKVTVGHYTLKNALFKKTSREALDSIFHLAHALPPARYRYKIGNKTIHAATPQDALALHLALMAPNGLVHKRKMPRHVPEVHQIWDEQNLADLCQTVPPIWANATP